jgi:hypothetical protein
MTRRQIWQTAEAAAISEDLGEGHLGERSARHGIGRFASPSARSGNRSFKRGEPQVVVLMARSFVAGWSRHHPASGPVRVPQRYFGKRDTNEKTFRAVPSESKVARRGR